MVHRTSQSASTVIGHPAAEDAAPFDFYTRYCEMFTKVYGPKYCPTREQWDAMCRQPRTVRRLTDNEFDDNQESITNGNPAIY